MSWRQIGCLGSLLLLALLAVPIAVLVATFSGNAPIVDGRVLSGGAVTVQDGYVSLFLVPLRDGRFALVDTGNDPEAVAIDRALTARGAVRDDVVAIFVTHGHPDHVAACDGFEEATVYVLERELPLLRGEVAPRGPLPRLLGASASPCPNNRTVAVADGATVTLGRATEVRVFAVPGHTAGSAAWWINGVLYLGDAADADARGRLQTAKWVFSDNQLQATRSLLSLAERVQQEGLHVDALAFAHTGMLDGLAPLLSFVERTRKRR